jgi:hypothetical protein
MYTVLDDEHLVVRNKSKKYIWNKSLIKMNAICFYSHMYISVHGSENVKPVQIFLTFLFC